jgi:hypothetical protein
VEEVTGDYAKKFQSTCSGVIPLENLIHPCSHKI